MPKLPGRLRLRDVPDGTKVRVTMVGWVEQSTFGEEREEATYVRFEDRPMGGREACLSWDVNRDLTVEVIEE